MAITYTQAQPSYLTKGQIWSLAESVATQLGFEPGDDVGALVSRLGGKVQVEDTLTEDPEKSGSLYVDAPDRFRIIVPAHTSRLRDRFTIAHELGHYVVHYLWRRQQNGGQLEPMVALRKGSERIEWEANWFAAAFLMPRSKFEKAFKKQGNISAIANIFGVSPQAAEVRAKQLDLA